VSNNIAVLAACLIAFAMIIVLWLVKTIMTKIILAALLVLAGIFVYVEQDSLKQCAATCSCELARQSVTVPVCRKSFPGDGSR
jgi:hypothetical protein